MAALPGGLLFFTQRPGHAGFQTKPSDQPHNKGL